MVPSRRPVPPPRSILKLLTELAERVVPAKGETPWLIGWSLEDHRNSGKTAIHGPSGPVTVPVADMALLEESVELLLQEQEIRVRWQQDELWGYVASLVAHAAATKDKGHAIRKNLQTLRTAHRSLVFFSIANAVWRGDPRLIGNVLLGHFADAWLEAVKIKNNAEQSSARLNSESFEKWTEEQCKQNENLRSVGASELVMGACWTVGQGELAVRQAKQALTILVDLCILLTGDEKSYQFAGMGGHINRPGLRGVALDRGAITEYLSKGAGGLPKGPGVAELVSNIYVSSRITWGAQHHWYSAEPFPLADALSAEGASALISAILADKMIVARRLRVTSRWFGEYHWATESDDAALALGVALDSLIGSKSGLPGRAMAERFALLEPVASNRRNRADRYNEIFGVRSSVAHGSRSSKLDDPDFVREMAADVKWAAGRVIDLEQRFGPSTERDFETLFEELRWGVRTW